MGTVTALNAHICRPCATSRMGSGATIHKLPKKPRRIDPQLVAPALLPPGEYKAVLVGKHDGQAFNRWVRTLFFDPIDEYAGYLLPYYANMLAKQTSSGKRLLFPARSSKLVRDFQQVFMERLPRLDRFPLSWLDGKTVVVNVRTVTKDSTQRELPEPVQYSVASNILRLA